MPLALAIIAGAIGDASGQGQGMVMLLSLAGLVVGGGLAAVLVKILKKRYSRSDDLCQYGPVLSEDMDT